MSYSAPGARGARRHGASGPSSTGRPLRVHAIGDSITRGGQDTGVDDANGGYRGVLHPRLSRARPVWFVGSQTTGNGPEKHDGYSGWGYTLMTANIAGIMAAQDPDVVLLYFGVNEIGAGTPAGNASTHMTGVVAPILARNTFVKCLCFPLFYFNFQAATYDPIRLAFNAALEPLVRAHASFGTRLFWGGSMATVFAGAGPDFYAAENVHPSSATGFPKMATVIYNEMMANGLF